MSQPANFLLSVSIQKYLRYTLCLLALVAFGGCTTYVTNEKKSAELISPIAALDIEFVENREIQGRLETVTHGGHGVRDWTKQQTQARRDVPLMLSLAKNGLTSILKPQLEGRKLEVANRGASNQAYKNSLLVVPKHYLVECGAMSLICQTSIYFEAKLHDNALDTTVWSADFKVGAPMGAEQTEDTIRSFYQSVVERLVSARVIL